MRIFTIEEQKFILDHQQQDTAQLMLQAKRFAPLPVPELVQQIKSRQKAQQKLPTWAKHPQTIFPVSLSVEQSSSEDTAAYKANLVKGQALVDLTGGFGVDSYYFARSFGQVIHIEQNQELQEIASYNFKLLGAENIQSLSTTAEEYLQRMDTSVDVIYLDPARRGQSQERVHLLQDCTPDVLGLLPLLLQKSKAVLLKTAPMLDIDLALQQLSHVAQVWVIAVQNECKEVLYLLKPEATEPPLLTTVNLLAHQEAQPLSFTKTQEENAAVTYSEPQRYLYEPNTALLKAGAYKWLSEKYGVHKLHRNSHLYTSQELQLAFPGRIFEIMTKPKANTKELQQLLPKKKANITTRNYPLTVAQLRDKVKLKEGGDDYLFATTDLHNKPILLLCRKAGV
ncbi:THUMP-like domain-containing protein [Rufibacter aurantiacus]|uniref:THUMP-like domain-containing protein n=1 Tax=Rufibacter aurantiacus TaxID=2817374 RepID=UPI001B311139|nr:RsmD family RNA methyltransferase [Rufibacter aurantiacus]